MVGVLLFKIGGFGHGPRSDPKNTHPAGRPQLKFDALSAPTDVAMGVRSTWVKQLS
jgi:hypothetical protein